jgi:lipopolysaccharide transport system permease protein
MESQVNENWTNILGPKRKLFDVNLKEIWYYKDLILLLVKRDFVAYYKQTILGPLWFLIQPIFTTIVFTVIFGKIAKIPTDGIPQQLFYMSGIVCWNYFSECLNKTSNTFVSNASIFGKVYFPRLVIPISIVITNLLTFLIQFLLFFSFFLYFYYKGAPISLSYAFLFLPLLVLQIALLGLGMGIIVSSLTTRYRDLSFAVVFGVQLWMYATPVVYPLSVVPEKYKWLFILNPMTTIIESFRYAFLGISSVNSTMIMMSWSITLFILIIGVILFNKVEKSFMDTV